MATTAEVLRSVPLFEGMTDDAVATIAGVAEELVYPAGSELTREGYPGESFIVIVTGRASRGCRRPSDPGTRGRRIPG